MRIFPILTALLVTAVLFLVVMQRERLVEFAGTFASEGESASQDDDAEDVAEATDEAPEAAGSGAEAPQGVAVVTLTSVAQEIDSAVLLRGRTEAARQVEVRAETSGLVISQPIRAGAMIEAGQLLCEIEPGTRLAALAEAEARLSEARSRLPEAEARVAQSEAALAEAEINDNAASRLSENGFASETRAAATAAAVSAAQAGLRSAQAGVEAAASGVQSAEAGLLRAEQEIENLRITAPFSGHLESDTAEIGSLLQPGSLCATVIQTDEIKLVGFVPEAQVDLVALGAPAGAELSSGLQVQGLVSFLSRSADPQTRTFRVEITIDNADGAIRDGQSADIAIAAPGEMAHLVPASALTLNDDGDLGLRLADASNRVRFVPVQMLRDSAEGILVSGLPHEARIIVVGQEFVTEGVAVIPHDREPRSMRHNSAEVSQ